MQLHEYNSARCLNELFHFLEKHHIPFCVVGDSDGLPNKISSDIDIVIPNECLASIYGVLCQFIQETPFQLVQLLKHEQTAYYFVFSLMIERHQIEYFSPDICGDYFRNGKLFLNASDLLQNRRVARTKKGINKSFYIPAPEMAFIYYLIKRVDKKIIDREQWSYLIEQYQLAPDDCLTQARKIWSSVKVDRIITCFKSNNLNDMQKLMPALQKELVGNFRPTLKSRWREFERKVHRVLQPTGIIVVLLGPDGVGKSAVGEQLLIRILPTFRGRARFHLRPKVFSKYSTLKGIPVTDPHGSPPRGFFPSLAKLVYFWFDYVFGYWLQVRPLKVRSNFVLFDRYYHDLMIDPKRYRYSAPMWLTRLVGRILPQPDLFIILDAPAAIIHSRKQEVTLEETQRQREAYLQFAKKTPNAIVLNTEQSLEATVNEGTLAVLKYMQERLKTRVYK